jgi:hypothetical protein
VSPSPNTPFAFKAFDALKEKAAKLSSSFGSLVMPWCKKTNHRITQGGASVSKSLSLV